MPLITSTRISTNKIGRQILHAISIPLLIPLYIINATTAHMIRNGRIRFVLIPPRLRALSVTPRYSRKNVVGSSPHACVNENPT